MQSMELQITSLLCMQNTKILHSKATSSSEQNKIHRQPHSDPYCSLCNHFIHLDNYKNSQQSPEREDQKSTTIEEIHVSVHESLVS